MDQDQASRLILIDKPTKCTSFNVIRILRKRLGIQKMGHAGTLDPRATGLLIIATGKKTKSLGHILKLPKEYEATIQLGILTNTGDLDGKIIDEKPVKNITEFDICQALQSMLGDIELPVPIYSAIKKDGMRLYKAAYKGAIVEPPTRVMHVYTAEFKKYTNANHRLDVVFNVKSGTYIRSLAEELGRKLGTVATIAELRRTKIGDYSLEHAEVLESFPFQP